MEIPKGCLLFIEEEGENPRVSPNFIPSNPPPPRRRHSSLPRLAVRSAVISVCYREATVPEEFQLHRKTMIMSLRREGMPSPSLSNLMVSPYFKLWLYIFYYYRDVDYMDNRRYDERSDYAGGLKAGRRLSSGTSSSNKYDQSCPVMELLTSSSWEFLLSQSEMAEKASGGGVGEAKQKEEEEKKEPGRRRRRNCDGRDTAA
ncbi:hypothetical protein Bca52824_045364 [Brassica carinata]|uniref:Uncharacterized protein n=1 Tax=Brassica carinata TaxID=52824 RepID=A0A8X7REX6_BRACI|nr:hypothetical protein Bca52824_045364 [Brassica carinata]